MKKVFLVFGLMAVTATFCSADAYNYLAGKISKGAKQLTNKKIAVLPFQYYDGRKSPGSTIVAEYLTTKIVEQGKLQVVERTLLNKVMEEMKLGKSGIIDQETTKEIGKILGVEAIVTGVLIEEDGGDGFKKTETVDINTRLIKVETGDILVASSKKINKTWEDEPESETEEPAVTEKPPAKKTPEVESRDEQPEVIKIGQKNESEEPQIIIPAELKQSYRSLTERRYRDAIHEAKNVFQQNQNKPVIASHSLFIIGRASEAEGDLRKARDAYLKIIEDYPYNKVVVSKAQHRLRQLKRPK